MAPAAVVNTDLLVSDQDVDAEPRDDGGAILVAEIKFPISISNFPEVSTAKLIYAQAQPNVSIDVEEHISLKAQLVIKYDRSKTAHKSAPSCELHRLKDGALESTNWVENIRLAKVM